jgi:CheY-like chemotaxis protein
VIHDLTDVPEPTWRARSMTDLLADQLAALEAWHLAAESAIEARAADSREGRMDLRRRQEVHARERAALEERAALHLSDPGLSLGSDRPRIVLAHRQSWYRGKVAQELARRGVDVVASLEDGIQASAAVILDQAELLLVEDRLPGLTGAEIVQRARRFSPRTLPAGQIAGPETMSEMLGAGAVAVFSRRIAPAEVAERLSRCLLGVDEPLSLI